MIRITPRGERTHPRSVRPSARNPALLRLRAAGVSGRVRPALVERALQAARVAPGVNLGGSAPGPGLFVSSPGGKQQDGRILSNVLALEMVP